MITYLIKSGLCLLIILGIYHLLLEQEKMHQFKRFYLLFGLVFSFIAPLVTVSVIYEVAQNNFLEIGNAEMVQVADFLTVEDILWYGYVIGFIFSFIRFLYQINNIFSLINKSKRLQYQTATLVLHEKDMLPYTFLNYIFINKKAYEKELIKEELFAHELTHARQRHSLDIILIELIQVIFWFNPLIRMYKKAIQLNHEFLADEHVVQSYQVEHYQNLLLDTIQSQKNFQLVSNFNFSITKIRLKMMTKKTSRWRSILFASATLPFFMSLLLLFGNEVTAQTPPKSPDLQKMIEFDKDAYFKNATFVIVDEKGTTVYKNYQSLTEKQKSSIPPPPPLPPSVLGREVRLKPLTKDDVIQLSKQGKTHYKVTLDKEKMLPPPPPIAPTAPKN